MSKFLNILKLCLLILLIIINWLSIKSGIFVISWWHVLYLVLLGLLLIVSIRDIAKKNIINDNKIYNILCIIVFIIMSVIFLRAMFDPHFINNDPTLINKLDSYASELYGDVISAAQDYYLMPVYYVAQNINYFLIMMILLFGYRFLNKSKDSVKTLDE